MMTHDEMIAVIAAHRDGKKIQTRSLGGIWSDIDTSKFNFSHFEYRVKPMPIEAWAVVNSIGKVMGACYANKDHAESFAINVKDSRIIRLVEEGGEV